MYSYVGIVHCLCTLSIHIYSYVNNVHIKLLKSELQEQLLSFTFSILKLLINILTKKGIWFIFWEYRTLSVRVCACLYVCVYVRGLNKSHTKERTRNNILKQNLQKLGCHKIAFQILQMKQKIGQFSSKKVFVFDPHCKLQIEKKQIHIIPSNNNKKKKKHCSYRD